MAGHEKAPTSDQASGAFQNLQAESTRAATHLIARLAQAHATVHRGDNGDFTVMDRRYGMSRYCGSYAVLKSLAGILGVRDV